MSCPQCPHCQIPIPKGGPSLLGIGNNPEKSNNEERETPKSGVRGKARDYSQAFELVWKAYPRKEQKFEAFAIWSLRMKEAGGESSLATLILGSLKWQMGVWQNDDYKFVPYFERYLKRRKWEDEPPTRPQAVPRHIDRSAEATDRKIAQYRDAASRAATPEEIRRAKEESQKLVRTLAEAKASG